MNLIVVDGDQARLYGTPKTIPQGQSQFSQVQFSFSEEWTNLRKVAQFEQKGNIYNVEVSDDRCFCPSELVKGVVNVRVKGYPMDTTSAVIATANEVVLPVSAGFQSGGIPSVPPTPDLYQKLIGEFSDKVQSDWGQNDSTAKDYVKNRTHYVSRESKAVVPGQEITTAVQNNRNLAMLNDVDFDILKTLFNSEDNTTFDVVFDGTSYQCKWLEQNGVRIPGFGNLAIADSSLTDTGEPFCTSLGEESGARDILAIACKVAGTHTVAVSYQYDIVHTIDPKYIKDMYYSEIAETIIGYGMNGWAVTTKNEAVPIPKMTIKGKVYENVPVDHTQMANVVYVVGGYTLTFNRMNNYMTTDPSDLSGADVAFYGQGTVYHQMPAWAVNLGGQGIYVADTTGSSVVVLDKMPEDCHFVVSINLPSSFTVDTVRYRGEDSPIISCKTQKQITYDAIPKYAMLLALTDDGWICVNPIA